MPLATRGSSSLVPLSAVPTWFAFNDEAMKSGISLATLLAYDAILTLDKEVKHFWKRPFSLAQGAFFLNRLAGIIGAAAVVIVYSSNPSLLECQVSVWIRNISYWITILAIDYVLMIRVLSLYQREKRMSIFLHTLLGLEAVIRPVMLIIIILQDEVALVEISSNHWNCGANSAATTSLYLVDWLLPIAYGLLLLGLALPKAVTYWRLAGFRGSRLVFVLIKDQVIYFVLATLVAVLAVFGEQFTATTAVESTLLDTLGSPTLLCVLGNHMFFNLHEVAERNTSFGSDGGSHPQSILRFDLQAGTVQVQSSGVCIPLQTRHIV